MTEPDDFRGPAYFGFENNADSRNTKVKTLLSPSRRLLHLESWFVLNIQVCMCVRWCNFEDSDRGHGICKTCRWT